MVKVVKVKSTLFPSAVAYRWVEHDGIGGSPRVRYAEVPPGHIVDAAPLYGEDELDAYADALKNMYVRTAEAESDKLAEVLERLIQDVGVGITTTNARWVLDAYYAQRGKQ